MDFWEVLSVRRSVRSYSRKTVPEDYICQILEALNTAPSAGDLQAYDVVVVKDPEVRLKLARASYGQMFIHEAPVSMVFLANPLRSARRYGDRGRRLYSVQDATIAATFAMLAATSLGLGTCWVGALDDERVAAAVGTNLDRHRPVAIITVGFPAETPRPTPRRSIEELVSLDSYGESYPYRQVRLNLKRPSW
ncbi:MAG TPA: nitroreductase [Candidatus Bathyarchaeota archaeon]|nr:nitroreductase [Candidatus Bathyarchaeota archaeon]